MIHNNINTKGGSMFCRHAAQMFDLGVATLKVIG